MDPGTQAVQPRLGRLNSRAATGAWAQQGGDHWQRSRLCSQCARSAPVCAWAARLSDGHPQVCGVPSSGWKLRSGLTRPQVHRLCPPKPLGQVVTGEPRSDCGPASPLAPVTVLPSPGSPCASAAGLRWGSRAVALAGLGAAELSAFSPHGRGQVTVRPVATHDRVRLASVFA